MNISEPPSTTETLLPALAAYMPRDRVENLLHPNTAGLPIDGVALIADISGFTPLTEALTHGLSPDRGAEELTRALQSVFTPLITEVHTFRGSVIKFGGDALIVWYPRPARVKKSAVVRRAVTSAWRMQKAIAKHGHISTPIGTVTLQMKVGLTYGPVKRFNLGLPDFGFEDVLGGQTLDRMAEAEHHARPGDIMLDADTLALLPANALTVAEWRDDFAAIDRLLRPARPQPWPALHWNTARADEAIDKLRPYVPPVIFQTLAAGRTQVAELKPVVSLFVQFHGINYDTDPAVADHLQTYFSTAQRVVNRYGGRLNRLITGDKGSLIHIIFGAPRTVEEQEARAVRCALDLQRECLARPAITMQRIGITTGRVFAGPVGSTTRHDYTTMGDSINLSARLMQNAANNQILLDESTRVQLGPEFAVSDLPAITVKGKSAPIPIFEPTAARTPESTPRTGKTQSVPIFGRDAEIKAIGRWLAAPAPQHGRVIVLEGEVGTGKTHIINAARAQAAGTIAWADGMSLSYGQTLRGYLFIDVFRDVLNVPPGAGPSQTSRLLLNFCRNLFGEDRLEATYPYLAQFMGLPLEGNFAQRLEGLSGESLRWQFFEIFTEMTRLFLQQQPLVLALDDLQWTDPTSLELLERLVSLVPDLPLTLILTTRPNRSAAFWAMRERIRAQMWDTPTLRDMVLRPLPRPDSEALIAHYAPNLPPRLVDFLVEKGGGSPLFLVELIRTMQAQGWLAEGVNLQTVALDALALPNSVQGLLLAQIDRLAVEARHTLQVASVVGKTVLYQILSLMEKQSRSLDDRLTQLQERDYLIEDDPTDMGLAYSFRHILIQESAYGTLLYERRRAYHRQVAECLRRLFPTQLAEQTGLLAFHYERAEDLDEAITYYLQAADHARLLYANQEAETLYHKALALFEKLSPRRPDDANRLARTYLKLAQVRANSLDFAGAQTYYEQAFALLEPTASPTAEPSARPTSDHRPLRLGVYRRGPSTLDPAMSQMVDVSEIISDLFEGLVELDTELNIIPAVARRWHIDASGTRYRFELRPGLLWSDGAPLTAHDFVFGWRRNLTPATGAAMAHQLYVVAGAEEFHQNRTTDPAAIGIRAIDDLTLEVTLASPTGYFLYLLAHPIAFPQPAHAIQRRGAHWAEPEHLVGNGPFKIARWAGGSDIQLTRNPVYRGIITGNVRRIELKFIAPTFEHYQAGQIDWCRIDNQSDIPQRFPAESNLAQYMQTVFVSFFGGHAPFNQVAMRQAFAHSVSRTELVAQVWANVQKPAWGGMVPPGMPGHSPEIGLRFNPKLARRLLKRAGFASGAELPPLTLVALPGFSDTPAFLQQSWQEHLGARITVIKDIPFDDIIARLHAGSVQMVLIGWDADYPDPDNMLRILFHSASPVNYFGWKHAEFDRLVERAAALSNQQERLALYHRADRLLVADEAAIAPLYYRQAYTLLRPGFRLESDGKVIQGGAFRLKYISMA